VRDTLAASYTKLSAGCRNYVGSLQYGSGTVEPDSTGDLDREFDTFLSHAPTALSIAANNLRGSMRLLDAHHGQFEGDIARWRETGQSKELLTTFADALRNFQETWREQAGVG
jgi:hypothetical protein